MQLPKWKAFRRNKPSNATRLCPLYQLYDPDFEKVPEEVLTHGYVKPDWQAMVKQLELFDHPEQDIDVDTSWAEDQIVDMLRFHNVKSYEIPLEEVTFNETANPGVGYAEIYGNKGNALKYGGEEIAEYWKTAHLIGANPLFYAFGKIEYLPFLKILENNLRTIECGPITHLAFQLRLCQSFNKNMYSKCEFLPVVPGVSFQQGGFDALLKRVQRGPVKFMGDVRKWDKWFMRQLRMVCFRIRVRSFQRRPGGMDLVEYKRRMEFVYEVSNEAPVLFPWGQVLLLWFMKSGDGNTTSDNCLGHWTIFFSYIKEEVPSVSHWRDCLNIMGLAIYADDHIGSTEPRYDFLAEYQRRRKFYLRFGFSLKEEDDVVKEGWEGLTFLGATIVVHSGMYAPKYDYGRIYSSIVFNLLDDPVSIYNKMCSLLLLSTFNGKDSFQSIQDILIFYVKQFDVEYGLSWTSRRIRSVDFALFQKGLPFIPDYEWCVNYWLGLESIDRGLAIHPLAGYLQGENHFSEQDQQVLDLFAPENVNEWPEQIQERQEAQSSSTTQACKGRRWGSSE